VRCDVDPFPCVALEISPILFSRSDESATVLAAIFFGFTTARWARSPITETGHELGGSKSEASGRDYWLITSGGGILSKQQALSILC